MCVCRHLHSPYPHSYKHASFPPPPPPDDGQAELFFDEAEVLAGLPAAQRDAVLAARAEAGLAVRDGVDAVGLTLTWRLW
jgi:hypothetical protein